jgi:integrase
VVEETCKVVAPIIADMIQLQLATGMRSGELVIMRGIDIDMTGEVWLYRPMTSKGEHRGIERVVAIGPRGQQIIRRHLKPNVEAFLFSPADRMVAFRAEQRENRKTRVQPSQQNRRKPKPRRGPGTRYSPTSFRRAIAESIDRYNEGKAERERLPRWHPHQLRHTRALELQREVGLDVARAALGHRTVNLTAHYAGQDIAAAAAAMAKIG